MLQKYYEGLNIIYCKTPSKCIVWKVSDFGRFSGPFFSYSNWMLRFTIFSTGKYVSENPNSDIFEAVMLDLVLIFTENLHENLQTNDMK